MLRHFFRQLFGLPVGGDFKDVYIDLVDIGTFRAKLGKQSAIFSIHTETLDNDRVSTIYSDTLRTWDSGLPIGDTDRNYLLNATAYWLETQGNKAQYSDETTKTSSHLR